MIRTNNRRFSIVSIFVISAAVLLLTFQNCARPRSGAKQETIDIDINTGGGLAVQCEFNASTLAEGESVITYQNSTAPFGAECVSETRTCEGGALSGSFSYASCAVNAPAACLFDGQTLEHDSSVTAYQSSTALFGSACVAETRACNDGSLAGSFQYASCEVGAPESCLFDGRTLAHGESVAAFAGSTAPYGSSCEQELRMCDNGVLSGTNAFASCNIDAPASCLFNGQTIAHGQDVFGYQSSSVAFGTSCQQEARTCDDGSLSGNYAFSSCTVTAPADCSFNGQTVAHDSSITAYKTATPGPNGKCTQHPRVCTDGILSGSFTFASCQ